MHANVTRRSGRQGHAVGIAVIVFLVAWVTAGCYVLHRQNTERYALSTSEVRG